MNRDEKLILLTNDDGINSPGLRAAAESLAAIAWVTVAAPRDQWTGAGRSMPSTTGGAIHIQRELIGGDHWEMYAVDGTPAQAVQHGLLELVPRPPDLVVSGINYGENVGTGVTISGTVGAALEAASFEIPALAVSLETPKEFHLSHSNDIDFSAAAHFTRLFAEVLLSANRPPDVDVLKVDVPIGATSQTPWRLTHQSRQRYFKPVKPQRENFSDKARVDYSREVVPNLEPDSDVAALLHQKIVSVTPLSLDLTSRIDLKAWESELRQARGGQGELKQKA
ncbi:MAG TPA: 5'/3'-nucleotidase SurE [Anaerolineales bacterium]|nr:5'/3'-nucleotidase SurE [Anaerolineales bacterium]